MSRFESERQNFIRAYTRLLVSSWSDESYMERLIVSPREILAQEGLEIPASIKIRIERTVTPVFDANSSDAALNTQVDLWMKAEEVGELVLYIPDAPVITTENLGAAELTSVSGGGAVLCCCCPCSCCV